MKKYPQVLVNVHSDNKAGLDDCQPIWDAPSLPPRRSSMVAAASWCARAVPSRWLRVMAEAETHELTQRVVDDIVEVVKRELP